MHLVKDIHIEMVNREKSFDDEFRKGISFVMYSPSISSDAVKLEELGGGVFDESAVSGVPINRN
jgi:hypothetical protein